MLRMWHQRLDVAGVDLGDGLVAAFFAGDRSAVAAVEVILTAMTFKKFAVLGDLDAFGDSLVCFEFGHRRDLCRATM